MAGASDGYIYAAFARACNTKEALPSWFRTDLTNRIVMREMDTFYEDGANISIPTINAFQYSIMKLGDVSKQELDDFLKAVRQVSIR